MMYSFSGDKVNEFKKGKYNYTKERLLKAIIIVVKDIRLFYAFDQSLKYWFKCLPLDVLLDRHLILECPEIFIPWEN
jgi:hypothetical protein